MTQLEQLTTAGFPDTYTVLGVRLLPLSRGHLLLMERCGCAFASDNESQMVSVQDLILGIAICSMSYEDFIEFSSAEKPPKPNILGLLYDGLSGARTWEEIGILMRSESEFDFWLRKWSKHVVKLARDENFNFFEKVAKFQEYMRSAIVVPKVVFESKQGGEGQSSGAHWLQSTGQVLMSQLGYTRSESLNIPVAESIIEYFKYLETNGAVTFIEDEDLKLIEAYEKKKKEDEQKKLEAANA